MTRLPAKSAGTVTSTAYAHSVSEGTDWFCRAGSPGTSSGCHEEVSVPDVQNDAGGLDVQRHPEVTGTRGLLTPETVSGRGGITGGAVAAWAGAARKTSPATARNPAAARLFSTPRRLNPPAFAAGPVCSEGVLLCENVTSNPS